MKFLKGLTLGLCILMTPCISHAGSLEDKLEDDLKEAVAESLDENISYSIDITTITGPADVSVSMANADLIPSASTIKVIIGLTVSDMVERGELAYTEDIKKDLDLALRFSDNEATNRLIDRIGFSRVNSYIHKLTGDDKSQLNRKMLAIGKENLADPKDLSRAMLEVYKLDNEVKRDMEKSLRNSSTKYTKLLKDLDCDYSFNKTGELIGIENDVALVNTGSSAFVISLLTKNNGSLSKEGQLSLINELGRKIGLAYRSYDESYRDEQEKKEESFKKSLNTIEKKIAYETYKSLIMTEATKKLTDLDIDPEVKKELEVFNKRAEKIVKRAMAYLRNSSSDFILTQEDEIVNLMRLIYTDKESIEDLDPRFCLAIYDNNIFTKSARLLLEKAPRASLSIRTELLSLVENSDKLIKKVFDLSLHLRD